MKVELNPIRYVRQPEYWDIEVTASVSGGIAIPVIVPYVVSLPLDQVRGTRGINVVWSDESEQIDVPPSDVYSMPAPCPGEEPVQNAPLETYSATLEIYRAGFSYPCPTITKPLRRCDRDLVINLKHPRLDEILGAIQQCVQGAGFAAAFAALLAAVVGAYGSIPGFAATAFKAYLVECLRSKGVQFASEIEVSIDVVNT
jgi:hypothetical protein